MGAQLLEDFPQTGAYFSALADLKNDLVRKAGKGKKILALGGEADAHILPWLHEGFEVVAACRDDKLQEVATGWLASGGDPSRFRAINADITAVPEPDSSYDLITLFSALCRLPDIDAVLKEIARLLRTGGQAILEFGNRRSLADIETRRFSSNRHLGHVSSGVMLASLAHAGLTIVEKRAFQLAPLHGGATGRDIMLNAFLKPLLAERAPDGRMVDEVIASSSMMAPFAFRHLFVVEKGAAGLSAAKELPPSADVNQAQNLCTFACQLLAAGKRFESINPLVRSLALNPNASAPALMLASLFEGEEERLFLEKMRKLGERWMRMKGIPPESLSSTHPDRYNLPTLDPNPQLDARYQLMLKRVRAAKTVVDLGSGAHPIAQATCAVDLFIDPVERHTGPVDREALEKRGVRFVNQAIDTPMPFDDHEFDFAYCAHVFEHLRDPAMACNEMMRIAKAGCILTPFFVFDILSGRTYHRWMMLVRGDTLFFFEKEPYEDRPFGSWPNVFDAILNDGNWFKQDLGPTGDTIQKVLRAAYTSHSPLSEVCFNWEGCFEYMIVRRDGSIQTSRKIQN